MFHRMVISVLLVAWATQIAPALCVAGVLIHPCQCSERAGGEHTDDCDHETGCSHEGNCAADPCEDNYLRVERQCDDGNFVGGFALCLPDRLTDDANRDGIEPFQRGPASFPVGICLPFSPSDVPLLI